MIYFTSEDIRQRRERLSPRWNEVLQPGEAVIVYAGAPVQRPGGLDRCYPFQPHPAYFWLTGRRRETEAVLYSKDDGWIEFQKEIGEEEAVWEGDRTDLQVDVKGHDIRDLEAYIEKKKFGRVFRLGQVNAHTDDDRWLALQVQLDRCRRKKDASEIRLIRRLSDIAVDGYRMIEEILKPGITENDIRIAFEAETFRKGSHKVPYDTIVGSGPNSAVLHAIPTSRQAKAGEMILVDAGCDIFDYCVDITRMFAVSGTLDTRQRALYELVLKTQRECVDMTVPGTPWREVHIHAATAMTEGLKDLGILRGSLSHLLERELISLFFPHGVGHLTGLLVRDTGQDTGLETGTYFGTRLRVDLTLEVDHLITVEPGCYFIPALLYREGNRERFREEINWRELEHWTGIGGVRIEDDILLTAGGNENLTEKVRKMG